MWRLTDDHAVIYTDDRATLKALFAYSRFPHQDLSRATTYERKNGRVFAWQFTFPVSVWNGVVRHLGRASITMLDQERWISSAEAAPQVPPPVVLPKNGKKSRSTASAAVAVGDEAAARQARKPASRPPVDLTQPLQPMSGAVSKAKAAKSRVEPAVVEAPARAAAKSDSDSSARNRTVSSPVATEERASRPEQPRAKRNKGSAAVADPEAATAALPSNRRATKPAPETLRTGSASRVRAGAKSQAGKAEKGSSPAGPTPAAVSPPSEIPGPKVSKKPRSGGSPPPERERPAGASKRRSTDEEQLLAELAEVQLRLAALMESVPPVAAKRSGRMKAAPVAAPTPREVKGGSGEGVRTPEIAGGRRKTAAAPEPALATAARRGAAAASAVLDAPASSAPRKRGPKPRQRQE